MSALLDASKTNPFHKSSFHPPSWSALIRSIKTQIQNQEVHEGIKRPKHG